MGAKIEMPTVPKPPKGTCEARLQQYKDIEQARHSGSKGSKHFTQQAHTLNNMAQKMARTIRTVNGRRVAASLPRLPMPSEGERKRILMRGAIKQVTAGDHSEAVKCPDCGATLEFFVVGDGQTNDDKASADRYNENKGYDQFNVCWRCWRCNNTHVPKLEGERACDCGCGKTFKAHLFIEAALRARGVL